MNIKNDRYERYDDKRDVAAALCRLNCSAVQLLSACQEDGGFLGGMKRCSVSKIYSERCTQGWIRFLSPPSRFL